MTQSKPRFLWRHIFYIYANQLAEDGGNDNWANSAPNRVSENTRVNSNQSDYNKPKAPEPRYKKQSRVNFNKVTLKCKQTFNTRGHPSEKICKDWELVVVNESFENGVHLILVDHIDLDYKQWLGSRDFVYLEGTEDLAFSRKRKLPIIPKKRNPDAPPKSIMPEKAKPDAPPKPIISEKAKPDAPPKSIIPEKSKVEDVPDDVDTSVASLECEGKVEPSNANIAVESVEPPKSNDGDSVEEKMDEEWEIVETRTSVSRPFLMGPSDAKFPQTGKHVDKMTL